ncbi:MAG TPA: hypothetical protein VK509_06255 [Polyangiales bacterium]|nr:hypothetical protein [Polyangiales bacterium]
MLRRSIGFGLTLTCLAFGLGCGDDDDSPDGGPAGNAGGSAAGNSGASGSSPGTRGGRGGDSGGSGGTAGVDAGPIDTELEGAPCRFGNAADCPGGLRCVSAGDDFAFGVCGRPCMANDDCGAERCLSLSGSMEDLHCVNFVREEFGLCGSLDTAACAEPRVCLGTSTEFPTGVCVSFCAVEGSDVDAGGLPIQACMAAQTCVDLDPNDDSSPGFCATEVGRGETCEPDFTDGRLCEVADICAPIDPNAKPPTDFRCREDCTTSNTCVTGTCTDVQGEFAYCTE